MPDPRIVSAFLVASLLPSVALADPVKTQPAPSIERRMRRPLTIAGEVLFLVGYLAPAVPVAILWSLAGSKSEDAPPAWPLVIPLAGPFVTFATASPDALATTFLVIDGVVQTAGLSMFIAGLAMPEEERPVDVHAQVGPGGGAVELSVRF